MTRPRRWWWLIAAVVVAAVIGSWLLRPDPYVATPERTRLPAARLDLAQRSFGDWVAERATAPAVAALGLEHVEATVVAQSGAMESDGSWRAAGRLTWQFRGDPSAAAVDVTVDLRTSGSAVRVVGLEGPGRVPLWLTDGAEATRSATAVVLTGPGIEHEAYARWADAAVTTVARVVRGWRGPLVVEVPSDAAALDASLAAHAGTYAQVAAVTASVDGSSRADAPVHVFVNPEVMGRLDDRSAQIVLSHEATHAATGAVLTTSRPLWLSEGFADYVALRDVTVPITTSAGQILALVRKDGPPAHLPGQAEFDSTSDHFGAEYEAAWLACVQLAQDAGEVGLVRLYDDVGTSTGSPGLDHAMRADVGYDVAELTRRWQRRLSGLAGDPVS